MFFFLILDRNYARACISQSFKFLSHCVNRGFCFFFVSLCVKNNFPRRSPAGKWHAVPDYKKSSLKINQFICAHFGLPLETVFHSLFRLNCSACMCVCVLSVIKLLGPIPCLQYILARNNVGWIYGLGAHIWNFYTVVVVVCFLLVCRMDIQTQINYMPFFYCHLALK